MEKLGKGKFLISQPHLEDPNFKRSVILLLEHNKLESVGCILNQYTEIKICDLITNFPDINSKVSIGGPVQKNILIYIHKYGNLIPESRKICHDIYWGGDFEILKEAINQSHIKENEIRFFFGYAGWEAEQLKDEIQDESWIISDMTKKMIFNQDKNIWKKYIKSMDEKYSIWMNMPDNPNLN
tara:strand:+ start:881 stop:1429 length:549 start_codon:yes stop_codon:yes gene_type:complete